MNNPNTTPGKIYAVTSPNGCTVTTDDGLTLTEIEAGKQGYFVAVSGNVTLSDDSAILTPVFKLAPWQKLALLGVLGGNATAWLKALEAELTALLDGSQFELAWLAGEKKLVVHTDRVSDELLAAVKATAEAAMPATATLVQYNHNMEISWRDINKYAACTNVADMLAVNPDYKNDLTSDGEWIYPLPEMVEFNQRIDGTYKSCGLSGANNLKRAYLQLPKERNINDICRECSNLEYMHVYAPVATVGSHYVAQCYKLKEMEIYAPNYKGDKSWENGTDSDTSKQTKLEKVIVYMPQVQYFKLSYKNTKLTTIDGEFPSLLTAPNFAPEAILKKIYVTKILNSLPTWTDGAAHAILLGIHIDHQNDEEVLAAIANAEAKGWTLTVRWNGTPTSTASTMAMGSLIYAKIGEHGLSDGTTERVLDWGHYVTDWEARGYEQFRSLASAYRYFGLPMPEETT